MSNKEPSPCFLNNNTTTTKGEKNAVAAADFKELKEKDKERIQKDKGYWIPAFAGMTEGECPEGEWHFPDTIPDIRLFCSFRADVQIVGDVGIGIYMEFYLVSY